MRRITLILMLIAIMALPSFAQGTWSLGADLSGATPTGNVGDMAKMGFGAVAWGAYNMDQNLSFTAKVGYLGFPGKDYSGTVTLFGNTYSGSTTFNSTTIIPILVGGRYFFVPPGDVRVYGDVEAGVYSIGNSGGVKFGFSPAVGGQYKIGDKMNLDLNVNYTSVSADDNSITWTWLGVAVGLEFALD